MTEHPRPGKGKGGWGHLPPRLPLSTGASFNTRVDLNALYFLSWQALKPASTSDAMASRGWFQKEQVPISMAFCTVLQCYSFHAKWHKLFPLLLPPPLGTHNIFPPSLPSSIDYPHLLRLCFMFPLFFPVHLDTILLDERLTQLSLASVAGQQVLRSILIPRKTLPFFFFPFRWLESL